MNKPVRPLDLSRSTPWFMFMLVVALVAFWPSYLSHVPAYAAYTHAHAISATIWILLLIAQPLAIRRRRMTLHRTTGQASYFIAPLVVTSIVLLAHNRIKGLEGGRTRSRRTSCISRSLSQFCSACPICWPS